MISHLKALLYEFVVTSFFQTKFPLLLYFKITFVASNPVFPPIIISLLTIVTLQLANFVLLEFLKVIVAVPADLAVTSPELFTVATLVLLLVH